MQRKIGQAVGIHLWRVVKLSKGIQIVLPANKSRTNGLESVTRLMVDFQESRLKIR